MNSHEKLKNELEKLFTPGTINKLNNTQIFLIAFGIGVIFTRLRNGNYVLEKITNHVNKTAFM